MICTLQLEIKKKKYTQDFDYKYYIYSISKDYKRTWTNPFVKGSETV